MNKLFVATGNKAKLAAARKVFDDFEIVPVDGCFTTNRQPLSEEETLECARKRALATDGEYRLGMEAGVTLINGRCFLVNFAVLVDKDNNEYCAGGSYYPLPDIVKDDLYQEGMELKDAITKEYGDVINECGGTIEFLTDKLVTRVDIFTHICEMLKGQMIKRSKEKRDA